MNSDGNQLSSSNALRDRLMSGLVIPAHPLVLNADLRLDEERQQALSAYYLSAGAGGLAVGVHTTQFAIRAPQHQLLAPVLRLARDVASDFDRDHKQQTVLVAGVCGATEQAVREAALAAELGYHAGLLSLGGLHFWPEEQLLLHARRVAAEIPLFGFYLQPAVGGRFLSVDFWREFVQIPQVVAIKVAPFNRYQTLDVLRALVEAERESDIALYTGNDDAIVWDLVSEFELSTPRGRVSVRFAGGLLGHWAWGTRRAAELLGRCRAARVSGSIPVELIRLALAVTDMNAAIFDARNQFAGCIPGIHEMLRRQGLIEGLWTLDTTEQLSPGQLAEIDRVCALYPDLLEPS